MDNSTDRTLLHFKYNFAYITLILLSVLLVVVTHKWTPQPRFTEYLANAATLASLLLALVAIIYSFVSSESISKSLGQISSISRDVRASKDEVSEFIGTAKDINAKAEEGAHQFHQASEQVRGDLANLNITLLSLDSHTKRLQETVSDIPTRLSQIEDKFGGLERAVNEKYPPVDGRATSTAQALAASAFTTESIDSFLEKSSLYENLMAVAIVLAYNSDNEFSVEDFCAAVKASIRNRTEGFISCMNAVGLASFSKNDPGRIYHIDHVDSSLQARALEYFNEYLEYVKQINPKQYFEFKDKLVSVQALFL